MNGETAGFAPTSSRRAVLAGLAGGVAATGGCVDRLRTVMGRQQPSPVTLTIKTLPADDDPYALLLARQLSEWFQAAGIGASVQPMASEELLRQVLVNHEFDLFVGRYPERDIRPDSLYSLLHSRFGGEPGWQNPFAYANLTVDDLLARQRRTTGQARRQALFSIQQTLARENPFTVLAFPDTIRAARTDRFRGFSRTRLASPVGLMQIERADPDATTLRMTTSNERVTTTLNPLLASPRRLGTVTHLVHDSLARHVDGALVPWLAESWVWTGQGNMDVTLRDDLSFHDGEPLTASDVAFTYEFLRDTSLGAREQQAPTMNYRGRSSLVDSASAIDRRTVRLRFGDRTNEVARRALTVPVLPRHVWSERTAEATVGGLDLGDGSTEALVTNDVPPVGSGPLSFESATRNDRIVLERFDDHFLHGERSVVLPDAVPDAVADGVSFDRFVLRHVGSDPAAIALVADAEADCTLAGVGHDVLRRIGENDELSLLVDRSSAFYFAGFNTRRGPFSNPRFRQLLARLVDRQYLAETVFSTFANPAVTPLAGTNWVPEDLRWLGRDPVTPFLGSRGSVDVEQARAAFREAGFQFDEQGRLLEG